MENKIFLCGITAEELHTLISPHGYTLKHALSLTNYLYKKKKGTIRDLRTLPASLIKYLEDNTVTGTCKPSDVTVSDDKTIKYLFRNSEGQSFETVFIPEGRRNTVCVSTQSGCRMGCSLCATGRYGFYGNLSAGDIVNQVLSLPEAEKVTHVVFMGMGEPMDNLENVIKACDIITAEWGLAKSPRNVTVSSVGITPAISEFLERSSCNLTLSLFSPFPDERKRFTGVENLFPAEEIIKLLGRYPPKKKRRLSIAYVMIRDVNDSDRHLNELKKVLNGLNIRVNILPFHPAGDNDFLPSPAERMSFFKHELVVSGISASVRKSRGADISAACGLLASALKK